MVGPVVDLIGGEGGFAGPVAQGGTKCPSSVGHTPPADGPGGIVEAPRGLDIVFVGQEVQLCFHV